MQPTRAASRLLIAVGLGAAPLLASAQIYRCDTPSGVPLYQNAPGPGCKSLDLPNITTIPAPKLPAQPAGPRQGGAAPGNGGASGAGQATGTATAFPKVDASSQRTRDLDRRRILEDELNKEEARLGELRAEFNGGEPDRRGDERNYQKYLDRVQRLKEDISRSESAVSSLRREMAALRD
jgi:hypothetical protein